MNILHVLLEDIYFDARVKKEILAIRQIEDYSVDLTYLKSHQGNEVFSDNDIVINRPNVKLIYNIKLLYWFYIWSYIVFYLYKILRRNKYSIIHVHNIQACSMVLLLKKITCNRNSKLIYDSHELFSEMNYKYKILSQLYKFLEPKLMSRADFVVHANESRMNYAIKKFGLDSSKNTFVNNYLNKFDRKSYAKIELFEELKKKNKKIILYQGALDGGRNLYSIVKNFKKGKKNKVLVLIGDGNEMLRIKQYVIKNNMSDSIILLGKIPHESLANYTYYADLGIVTYANDCLNNYFCAPNKISEYVASGVPVLGINFPEILKLVDKYRIGCIFSESEIENIGEIVDKCLLDFKNKLDDNSMEAFFKTVNWDNEVKKLLNIYKNL